MAMVSLTADSNPTSKRGLRRAGLPVLSVISLLGPVGNLRMRSVSRCLTIRKSISVGALVTVEDFVDQGLDRLVIAPALSEDTVGNVETHGVDVIPASARHSKPNELFFVFLGSQMCFGIIVIGALPIIFGLGFWAAVLAITVGIAVGSTFFGLLAMLGAKTGTNGPVASGAHFGVKGRVIGSMMCVMGCLGFYALTVWTGGEALVAAGTKLLGWPSSSNLLAGGAVLIWLLTFVVAIFGHATIVATETLISYVIGAILIVAVIALAPQFNSSYAGGNYVLHSFWRTWLLAASVSAALPISYAPVLNDYSRYLPENTSMIRASWAAGGGMFVGSWLALVFAAYVTTIFKSSDSPFVSGLMKIAPAWLAVLIAFVGLIGSQPQGSLCLYNAGLGLQTIVPRANRVPTTMVLSLIGLLLVFSGIYLTKLTDMLSAFITLLECSVTPWLAINLVGYFKVMRGHYEPHDLLRRGRGAKAGRYWYKNGWNGSALAGWFGGVIGGLLFVESDVMSGPLAVLTGGTSVAWLIAGVLGGGIYWLLQKSVPTTSPN
jgi:purine-cytosine permease-like protein